MANRTLVVPCFLRARTEMLYSRRAKQLVCGVHASEDVSEGQTEQTMNEAEKAKPSKINILLFSLIVLLVSQAILNSSITLVGKLLFLSEMIPSLQIVTYFWKHGENEV